MGLTINGSRDWTSRFVGFGTGESYEKRNVVPRDNNVRNKIHGHLFNGHFSGR